MTGRKPSFLLMSDIITCGHGIQNGGRISQKLSMAPMEGDGLRIFGVEAYPWIFKGIFVTTRKMINKRRHLPSWDPEASVLRSRSDCRFIKRYTRAVARFQQL